MDWRSRLDRRYSFILPPGWIRLDLRGDLRVEARKFAEVVLVDAPRDRAHGLKEALTTRVLALCEGARAQGVLDLVLPVPLVAGSSFDASFAVLPFDAGELDPVTIITGIAARDGSAQLVEVADLVALRTEETEAVNPDGIRQAVVDLSHDVGLADPADGTVEQALPTLVSRRVRYYLGHPERPDDWVLIVLSAVQTDAEHSKQLADVVVQLFDQIMLTVRFPRD